MRKASDSTQLIRLRKDFMKVTKERQAWATKARKLEAANVRWALRFDALLKHLTAIGAAPSVSGSPGLFNVANCFICGGFRDHGHICPGPSAVSRETEGTP